MVSSTGDGAADDVGTSTCAKRRDEAAMRHRKTVAARKFTSATVLAKPESTSGNLLMPFEEAVHLLGKLRPDPFGRRDLLHRRFPQPVH